MTNIVDRAFQEAAAWVREVEPETFEWYWRIEAIDTLVELVALEKEGRIRARVQELTNELVGCAGELIEADQLFE